MDYRVDTILNKYKGELPKVYDQKINDHIKEIGEALGWTEIVELEEQRGAMEYTAKKKVLRLTENSHVPEKSCNQYAKGWRIP